MNGVIKSIIGLIILYALIIPAVAETTYINSTTQSDQDLILLNVIQIDEIPTYPDNKFLVREVLYFNNYNGINRFYGFLRTWVPDDVKDIKLVKAVGGEKVEQLQILQNGNVISWQDSIETNTVANYILEYIFTVKGTSKNTEKFTKKFFYPPLINKVPRSITLILSKDNTNITDEKGNNLYSLGNPRIYDWQGPEFKELNIDLHTFDALVISAEVLSYSDNPNNEIYVGSLIYYNITVYNPNKYGIARKFNITISDSNGEIIHDIIWDPGFLYPNQSVSFLPYKFYDKNKYEYISPLKPDTYVLKVSNIGEPLIFHENKTNILYSKNNNTVNNYVYRNKINYIEFPFPVASQYEKRLKELNEKEFNENKELNYKLLSLNEKLLDLTDKLEMYTYIILIATVLTLVATIVQLRKKR